MKKVLSKIVAILVLVAALVCVFAGNVNRLQGAYLKIARFENRVKGIDGITGASQAKVLDDARRHSAGIRSIVGMSPDKEDGKRLAAIIWQYGQEHPDGFTVDVRTLAAPEKGIAVSYAATLGCATLEDLEAVVLHALEHDGYAGGWLNPADGRYYFDSTRLFPEDDLDAALAFALENGQTSVYVLSTGEDIPVR